MKGVDLTDTGDLGGPHLLDGLWRELGLDDYFSHAFRDRRFDAPVERAILAMVAQRALAPDSKLAGAMDELREHLYFQVTDLLNADVSVLFCDTCGSGSSMAEQQR